MENKSIIQKADIALASLANGGLLNTEQSNKFLEMVQHAPTIINTSRFVPMASDSRKIEKLGFGQRILRAGTEGTALAASDRAVPTTDTITLNAKEVIAEVNITYDTLENNIEGNNFEDTIMRLIAERAALDIEELVVNGDTDSADAFLALVNGLRKQAVSHKIDGASAALTKDIFKNAYKAMPAQYIRNPQDFRFYTSFANEIEWKDQIAGRQTALGDAGLQGGLASAYGIPVRAIAMLQAYDNGAGKNVNDILLTHPQNILVGMSRQIRIEVDKDIRARKYIIVLTAKVDTLFEEEDAVVKVEKVLY